jgi:solute carrier family 13 (sodium-dependent dicarboxylate transporter), member 2/3/5
MKEKIGLILGPLTFIIILLATFEGLTFEGKAVMAVTAWVAVWWITEPIPIAASSLLPVVLFPLSGSLDIKTTTTTYFSPMVVLFMGGFMIALALERWNLHQRIALTIINFIGTNSSKIILGFMISTAFLSMWISNTATALMMLPIAIAIAKKIGDLHTDRKKLKLGNFNKALMLSIAYAASIGGMATLIGTPTNAIFSAISLELYDHQITFARWIILGFPISFVCLLLGWLYLTKVIFRGESSDVDVAKHEVKRQLLSLGNMTYEERMVLFIFTATASAWILSSFVLVKFIPGIDDTVIAIAGALLLFVVPAKNTKEKLMDWKTAKKLPWGILLLFGGGLSIAAGFKSSGLADWFGDHLVGLDQLHFALVLFVVVIMVNYFTEITSNVATASVLLPILASLSKTIDVHPFGLMVGASLASSCAFMLPVATPPNAIAYSAGYLTMGDMVKAGFWMNVISTIILFLMIYYLMPIIWGVELLKYPEGF